MQETLALTKEWLGPYAAELRVAASIAGVVVLALIVRILAGKALRMFFEKVSARAALVEERKRIETVSRVTRRTVSLLIVLVTAMVVLNQLGISIAPILGAAGVVGIAVGFGAQSLVKDVFAGVVLLIENQIRVGDVVEIAGLSGVVEELSLRKVKLRSYDGSVHYISNGLITTVTNRSTEFAYAVMDIGVGYRESVDRVYEVMREVAAGLQDDAAFKPRILGELEIAGVEQWADSAVVIRCRIKTQPLEQWGVRREYLKRLKAAFDEQGISIPFPHRTIIHENAPGPKDDPASPPSPQLSASE
ncbi:MAG: hypothetical protein ABS55_04865 [Lautropia sp. SCN 70-15]|nr:MAG: hypothetical protein ABS55_04865 [Lautropia sp. SCN 70-15]